MRNLNRRDFLLRAATVTAAVTLLAVWSVVATARAVPLWKLIDASNGSRLVTVWNERLFFAVNFNSQVFSFTEINDPDSRDIGPVECEAA